MKSASVWKYFFFNFIILSVCLFLIPPLNQLTALKVFLLWICGAFCQSFFQYFYLKNLNLLEDQALSFLKIFMRILTVFVGQLLLFVGILFFLACFFKIMDVFFKFSLMEIYSFLTILPVQIFIIAIMIFCHIFFNSAFDSFRFGRFDQSFLKAIALSWKESRLKNQFRFYYSHCLYYIGYIMVLMLILLKPPSAMHVVYLFSISIIYSQLTYLKWNKKNFK